MIVTMMMLLVESLMVRNLVDGVIASLFPIKKSARLLLHVNISKTIVFSLNRVQPGN